VSVPDEDYSKLSNLSAVSVPDEDYSKLKPIGLNKSPMPEHVSMINYE
jgi:hypothetical protein